MLRKQRNYIYRGSLQNPFHDNLEVGTRYVETAQQESAIVVDVIVNDTHPEYSKDGYNVGVIKFRFLDSQDLRPDESLNLAFPLDPNITRYPLLNELVSVFHSLNRFYYTTPFNVSNRPTAQAVFGLKGETDPLPTSTTKSKDYDANASGGAPQKQDPSTTENKLGTHFIEKTNVFRLRPQEGDVIVEGRSGQSFRFGANFEKQQAPNILIRVGPNPTPQKSIPNSPFALVDEDINKDLTSVWLIADQKVPLNFATVGNDIHFRSMTQKPSTLEGAQVVVNTDRIILNTKQKELLVSTFLGTHFTTLQDHTVDAGKDYRSFAGINQEVSSGQNYRITVGQDYLLNVSGSSVSHVTGKTQHVSKDTSALVGSKVFIGTLSDESEPQVLGEQLRQVLLELVDAHLNNAASHVVPTIGIGPLSPSTVKALQQVRQKLISPKQAPFESQNNFITKTNTTQ